MLQECQSSLWRSWLGIWKLGKKPSPKNLVICVAETEDIPNGRGPISQFRTIIISDVGPLEKLLDTTSPPQRLWSHCLALGTKTTLENQNYKAFVKPFSILFWRVIGLGIYLTGAVVCHVTDLPALVLRGPIL